MLELVVISFLIGKSYSRFDRNYKTIVADTEVIIVTLLVIGKGFFLSLRDTSDSTQSLDFKAPFVPWLPIVALFANISLMFQLSPLTWYRFVVWLGIGKMIFGKRLCKSFAQQFALKLYLIPFTLRFRIFTRKTVRKNCKENSPLLVWLKNHQPSFRFLELIFLDGAYVQKYYLCLEVFDSLASTLKTAFRPFFIYLFTHLFFGTVFNVLGEKRLSEKPSSKNNIFTKFVSKMWCH